MPKPIVAVDIDDVLVDTAGELIANYNQTWGTKLSTADLYVPVNLQDWDVTDEEMAYSRIHDYEQSDAHFALGPTPEAVGAMRAISMQYRLHALTGRPDLVAPATQRWIDLHFPSIFDGVSFSNLFDKTKVRSKGEMCVEIGATVLIDDFLGHALSAAECGLDVALYGDYPWNRADTLPSNITRCADWAAVLRYFEQRSQSNA